MHACHRHRYQPSSFLRSGTGKKGGRECLQCTSGSEAGGGLITQLIVFLLLVPLVDYELSPWEETLLDKRPIIAPDGFVPNSIVRDRIFWKPPVERPVSDLDRWEPLPVSNLVINTSTTEHWQISNTGRPLSLTHWPQNTGRFQTLVGLCH